MVGDAELAVAAATGDRAALGQIYDRYADTLYELCRVILRDPHEASDAVHDTFVIAATRLSGLREKDRLKPWLCAIARHESFRRSSKRARNRPSHDKALDVAVADNAADRIFGNEAANLVWSAAEALTERERVLLELNVRQGFEGAELAEAAGLTAATASVALSRAKSQLAVAVRCTLLVRFGRSGCAELASIAPSNRDGLDALTRKRVARHALGCVNCEPRWNSSPDALGILSVAPIFGVPAALKSKVLHDPRLISTSRPLGGRGWRRDGFPPMVERERRPFIASAAAVLLIAVFAALLVFADNDDTRQLAAPDSFQGTVRGGDVTDVTGAIVTYPPGVPVTTPAGEVVHDPTGVPVTVAPGTPVTNPNGSFVTSPPATGGANTTEPPGSPTTPPTSPPTSAAGGTTTPTTVKPTTTTQRLAISAQPRSSQVWSCAPTAPDFHPNQTGISATTTGGPTPAKLWVHLDHGYGTVEMLDPSQTGGPWIAEVGPFPETGSDQTLTAFVSDRQGSGGTLSNPVTIVVHSCT